jgi:hypothetical protein
MNLQEEITRISHLIIEIGDGNNKSNFIGKMIDKIGFYRTVRMVGTDDILNYLENNNIDDDNKIKFIKNIVEEKTSQLGTPKLSIFQMGVAPVIYDGDANLNRQIASFSTNGVLVNVFRRGVYVDTQAILYEWFPKDILDRVLHWFINLMKT